MKTYCLVASIIRSRGVKGEVEVLSIDDLLLRLLPGARLWVVPPALEAVRNTRIVQARGSGEQQWLTLEGVNDRAGATLLVGRYLLAAEEDCRGERAEVPSEPAGYSQRSVSELSEVPSEAVGLEVIDEAAGLIGTVIEQSLATPQVLWTVKGACGEVLIPAVSAFIRRWDDSTVWVNLPRGLLELNK
jgi:ribosomal 30S subunit maturation factor RimM